MGFSSPITLMHRTLTWTSFPVVFQGKSLQGCPEDCTGHMIISINTNISNVFFFRR